MTNSSAGLSPKRVVVIGGGISGLTAAYALGLRSPRPQITILEMLPRLGGVISASPFAGLRSVDESADAFLIRAPAALDLARQMNLGSELTEPATGSAYIWNQRLHDVPEPTLLGIPATRDAIYNTKLLSSSAKVRASLEPLIAKLRGSYDSHDCLGALIRNRFGAQVLERIVDPLVGSIYATDADRFSLLGMPQIADLVSQGGSLMHAANRVVSTRVIGQAVFAAPLRGMSSLVDALRAALQIQGAEIRFSSAATSIEQPTRGSYIVHTDTESLRADAIVLASPARATSPLLANIDQVAAQILAASEHASVVMVSLAVSREQWPSHLTGSGYLVPKPMQRAVTAASFGSNKWKHWKPHDNAMVLRISLGRDGLPMHHNDDDTILKLTLDELERHIGVAFTPHATRITRWVESFPQYRPGHFARVEDLEATLRASAPGVVVTGASYRGIGIPACVQQARFAADLIFDAINL